MINLTDLTDRERELATAAQGPGTGMCLALADLELYWENHREHAPDVHELRVNIRIIAAGSITDRLAAVQAVADWLGVEVHERYGTHFAQRRFGTGADSVIVEAHFTPDQDAAHAQRAAAKAEAGGRLAEVAALCGPTTPAAVTATSGTTSTACARTWAGPRSASTP